MIESDPEMCTIVYMALAAFEVVVVVVFLCQQNVFF